MHWRWLQPLARLLCWLFSCIRALKISHHLAFQQDGEPLAPISERINIDSMTVPASYQGPRMEGELITSKVPNIIQIMVTHLSGYRR